MSEGAPVDWTLSEAQVKLAEVMWDTLERALSVGEPVSVKALLDGTQEVVVLGVGVGGPVAGYRSLVPLVIVIDPALSQRLGKAGWS